VNIEREFTLQTAKNLIDEMTKADLERAFLEQIKITMKIKDERDRQVLRTEFQKEENYNLYSKYIQKCDELRSWNRKKLPYILIFMLFSWSAFGYLGYELGRPYNEIPRLHSVQ
jgi:glucan phosphorylase